MTVSIINKCYKPKIDLYDCNLAMLSCIDLRYQIDIVSKGIPYDKFEKTCWDLLPVLGTKLAN